MPWSVKERDGQFCVVKDADSSTVKCHGTRAEALAHQRALYANEPGVKASIDREAITQELTERFVTKPQMIEMPAPVIQLPPQGVEIQVAIVSALEVISTRLERNEQNIAATTSLLKEMMDEQREDREVFQASLASLTAALVFPAPEVTVNVPEQAVNVNVPETVVNLPAPKVDVHVDVPQTKREVVVKRDHDGMIVSAEVTEAAD